MSERQQQPQHAGRSDEPAWHVAYGQRLDRQLELLTHLEELSQQQRGLLEGDEAEKLLEVVQLRQVVVDELVALDGQSHEARERMERDGAQLARSVRESLVFKLQQVATRAKGVMQRDAKDQEALQRRRKQLAEELAELAGGKKAIKAYAPQGGAQTTQAVFQDREG